MISASLIRPLCRLYDAIEVQSMSYSSESLTDSKSLSIFERLSQSFREFQLLVQSIPTVTFALFIVAVFSMNLLANKSVDLPVSWLALDCGFIVSWFVFLVLDILTKHFGPKAATQISIFAMVLNLLLCGIFFLVSLVPGTWGESYVEGSEVVINTALNNTFGGTWYIIFGSAAAFTVAAFTNNFLNFFVGKAFKRHPNGLMAYLSRSLASTAVAQFVDNFVFAFLVSRVFFGWSLTQCITCAFLGMLFELLCQVIFSLWGYRISENWRKNKVGDAYLLQVAPATR